MRSKQLSEDSDNGTRVIWSANMREPQERQTKSHYIVLGKRRQTASGGAPMVAYAANASSRETLSCLLSDGVTTPPTDHTRS
jgi:hypothetical protein